MIKPELLAALKAAKGWSYDLGTVFHNAFPDVPVDNDVMPLCLTSVDAALAFAERMLPGWFIKLEIWAESASCHIGKSWWPEQTAPTVPLAIVIAVVEALTANEESNAD